MVPFSQLITDTLLYTCRLWRKAKLRERRQCRPSTHAPIKSCFISCLNRDIPKKKRRRSSGRYRPSWNAGMFSWQPTIQMWTSLLAFFVVCYWYDLAGNLKPKPTCRYQQGCCWNQHSRLIHTITLFFVVTPKVLDVRHKKCTTGKPRPMCLLPKPDFLHASATEQTLPQVWGPVCQRLFTLITLTWYFCIYF